MNLLITDCTILPMTGAEDRPFLGTIGVSGSKISMISRADDAEAHVRRVERFASECAAPFRRIDGRGMVAMPGLVNTHGHASMCLMRGFADDMPLFKWLNEYIWPFESKLTPEAVRIGAQLAIAEMLLGGTTTFLDMYWMEAAVAQAVGESGIRAVLSPTFLDDNFDTFLGDLETVAAKYKGAFDGRIGMMIAPHSPYTCNPDHIRRSVELAGRYGVGLTTHVSETLDEVKVMRERYGKTSTEYLRDLDFFSIAPALAVHTVHVTESDMDIFAHFGISVAHNPQSNMKISSGIAPITRMLEKGINVSIGTDGCCSNNDLDMWEEMRSASFLQKVATMDPLVMPAYEVLKMGTANGARALGMGDCIGTLEEGKLADIILIDTRKPHLTPCYDVVANLVYCGKAADVNTVIVNGEVVVENGKCLTLDIPAIRHTVEDYVESRRRNG